MRISGQLLRNRSKLQSLQLIEYVDLSHLGISIIEKLGSCKKLQTLKLNHNGIEGVSTNIELCPDLWNIDLSNNRVRSLDGFRRFVAFGTLNLANNKLLWSELSKIQHLHILDLHLHGNSELEKDPYYRIHVIDCLPHIWMLDGRLVTSAERVQVKTFFEESAVSDRPVRHKLAIVKGFTPSHQQNIRVNGIFGTKTIGLMRRFPLSETPNVNLDIRRLIFLAQNIAGDLQLEDKSMGRKLEAVRFNEQFLEELLDVRKNDLQKGNMLLVLLLASLDFSIPNELFKDTLEITKLDRIGKVYTVDIFLLPPEKRTLIACILLSSVKIERVENKSGGLYNRLYLCMNFLVTEAVKSNAGTRTQRSPNAMHRKYRSLLAAEVVLLMCYVPTFVEYIQKEPGVMSLVSSATSDTQTVGRIMQLGQELQAQQQEQTSISEAVGHFVQAAVLFHLNKKSSTESKQLVLPEERIFAKKPLPRRPMSGPIFSSNYHARGQPSPDMKPTRVTSARPKRTKVPEIGDTVLVGPQSMARVVSLPQPDIALLLLEMIPVNGAMKTKVNSFEEHYAYIDASELRWDMVKSFWRPKGTVGDRLTMHYVEDEIISVDTLDLRQPQAHTFNPVCIPKVDQEGVPAAHRGSTNELMCVTPHHPPAGRNTPEFEDRERVQESPTEVRLASQIDGQLQLGTPNEQAAAVIRDVLSHESQINHETEQQQPSPGEITPDAEQRPVAKLDHHSIVQDAIAEGIIDNGNNIPGSDQNALPVDTREPEESSPKPIPAGDDNSNMEQQKPREADANNNNAEENAASGSYDTQSCPIERPKSSRLSRPGSSRRLRSAGQFSRNGTEIMAIENENSVTFDLESDVDDVDDELTRLITAEETVDNLTVTVDLSHDIPSRVGAPTNSPELAVLRAQSSTERAERVNLRTPNVRVTSLHDMIKSSDPRYQTPRPTSSGEAKFRIQSRNKDDEDETPYLRKRTDAWNIRIQDNEIIGARQFMPPDPYDYYCRGNVTPSASAIESAVHGPSVRWGNLWMAGGRDLHYEEMCKRPSSAHVPGWRDGLKGSAPIKSRKRLGAKSACPSSYRYMMNTGAAQREARLNESHHEPVNTRQRWPNHSAQGIRSSFLKSSDNMRDDTQLRKQLRIAAWSAYIDQVKFDQNQISNPS